MRAVRVVRYWFFVTLYTLVVFVAAYLWQSGGEVPAPLAVPFTEIQERIHPPEITYRLVTVSCETGRRGECQHLVMDVADHTGTTTTILDGTLTERYESAGGRGSRLELLSVAPAADVFYLEEIFSSSQPRQLFRLEGASGTLTTLPWRHQPFAGDRISPAGRYLARASADFRAVEIFDLFTTTSSTPLRLAADTETLIATSCGFAGESPSFSWLTESTLSVEIFVSEPERAGACAGPLARTVSLVVE